jgi:hypothetical protein
MTLYEIGGSHSSEDVELGLLCSNATQTCM